MASFNVIEKPFIPVRYKDTGTICEISIRQAFEDAHKLWGIVTNDVFQKYGLSCFLSVFAMDMYEPERIRDIRKLYEKGSFDMNVFDTYVRKCELEKPGCFDLFDKEHPFMQVILENATAADKKKILRKVSILDSAKPSGDNVLLRCNTQEVLHPKFTYAECARNLITLGRFLPSMAGEGYSPGPNGDSPYYFLVQGKNLYENIVLNMVAKSCISTGMSYNELPPTWREINELPKEIKTTSLLQGMTLVSREIQLIPNEVDECVEQVYLKNSSKCLMTFPVWRDPHTALQKSKTGMFILRPKNEESVIWLEQMNFLSSESVTLPTNISEFENIVEDSEINVAVYSGYNPGGKAKYTIWKEELLHIPSVLFYDTDRRLFYKECLTLVSEISGCIKSSLVRVDKSYFYEQVYKYIQNILISSILAWATVDDQQRDEIYLNWKLTLRDMALDTYELSFKRLANLKLTALDGKIRRRSYIGYAEEYKKIKTEVVRKLGLLKKKKKGAESDDK